MRLTVNAGTACDVGGGWNRLDPQTDPSKQRNTTPTGKLARYGTAIAEHLAVRVESAHEIEERLNAVVLDLQPVAARVRQGLLETRLSPGHFAISQSEESRSAAPANAPR